MFFVNQFQHPNILPILGLDASIWIDDELPSIILPWMHNGTIMEYLKAKVAAMTRMTHEELHQLVRRIFTLLVDLILINSVRLALRRSLWLDFPTCRRRRARRSLRGE